jgi:hypothetical protein
MRSRGERYFISFILLSGVALIWWGSTWKTALGVFLFGWGLRLEDNRDL